jgi:hypothetical protein
MSGHFSWMLHDSSAHATLERQFLSVPMSACMLVLRPHFQCDDFTAWSLAFHESSCAWSSTLVPILSSRIVFHPVAMWFFRVHASRRVLYPVHWSTFFCKEAQQRPPHHVLMLTMHYFVFGAA